MHIGGELLLFAFDGGHKVERSAQRVFTEICVGRVSGKLARGVRGSGGGNHDGRAERVVDVPLLHLARTDEKHSPRVKGVVLKVHSVNASACSNEDQEFEGRTLSMEKIFGPHALDKCRIVEDFDRK